MVRAWRVNIRPSWPPPRTPSVAPGRITRLRQREVEHPAGLARAEGLEPRGQRRRRRAPAAPPRKRPAFCAPATPMAKVATGTPAGICTMESSESSPWRCRLGTGTPSTGSRVFAASMPGRWAAPPAPAMMHRSPAPRRLLGVAEEQVGRAVGGDHPPLIAISNSRSRRHGVLHDLPVRVASHHHSHEGRCHGHLGA